MGLLINYSLLYHARADILQIAILKTTAKSVNKKLILNTFSNYEMYESKITFDANICDPNGSLCFVFFFLSFKSHTIVTVRLPGDVKQSINFNPLSRAHTHTHHRREESRGHKKKKKIRTAIYHYSFFFFFLFRERI